MTSEDKHADKSAASRGIAFGTAVAYDDAYHPDSNGDNGEHLTSLPTLREEQSMHEDSEAADTGVTGRAHPSTLTAEDNASATESNVQDEYRNRRFYRDGVAEEGYKQAMQLRALDDEKARLISELEDTNSATNAATTNGIKPESSSEAVEQSSIKRRRRRWDDDGQQQQQTNIVSDNESTASNRWEEDDTSVSSSAISSRRRRRWDETPVSVSTGAAASVDATPLMTSANASSNSAWGETPVAVSTSGTSSQSATGATRKRSRWDSTPAPVTATPAPNANLLLTPSAAGGARITKALAMEREMAIRNAPWSMEVLDSMLPGVDQGYSILNPPESYKPLRTPGRKLLATPTPAMTPAGFIMQDSSTAEASRSQAEAFGVQLADEQEQQSATGLPFIKPEDYQYFGTLLNTSDIPESELSKAQRQDKLILTLLLKIKCGTPPQRKTAMRQITDKAREFGAERLFNHILPLLTSPTLEDQERHLLVKVIDRVLYQLDDLVRPYVHRIMTVISPLLIDEDYFARVEGREIISNLAKAAGLPTMIATLRPDIDAVDEYVRNVTSRAFAVIAGALGVPSLLPFLKAVCQSRKSWQARHTGVKIVQQIASLMGCAILPYLKELVDSIAHGLNDEQGKVRIMTALTLAALAEAAHPYGIESFDVVLRPLWLGIQQTRVRGKTLAAYLKAIGYIIPLMEAGYAAHYTREVMPVLIRECTSPDEEMKKIVLKVIQQCVKTDGVTAQYIHSDILPEFFPNVWIRRMALDHRNAEQVVLTTVALAHRVGNSPILERIVDDLKDDSEAYRSMVMQAVQVMLQDLGAGDIDASLEERLVDGMLYAFQEQGAVLMEQNSNSMNNRNQQVMLDGFGTVMSALGVRSKPYLKQITATIKWRLNNKSAYVRMQAADLISRIARVMQECQKDQLMGHLGVVLYEYLGEEYPEVLGSILSALRAIVNVIGMTKMTPPIRDLLPRLTPILRNRHEKVQENCIDLVGRIADRGAEYVSAKEWMRICFELLEMLKAHKKAIRRAAVSTFGYIAKAIGPQDVLHTLLNNLKVQDRQMRVCTTVAIAIVAETCGPFTVLPAIMNEYRVPELNIQNGVLKALSFMFEYIGDISKDYIFAVAPLIEDALMDRDPVHRQTSCSTVKHLALGVAGLGCEDALLHLLNFVWPNIFEESPHVIRAVFDAVEGLMVGLGPNVILQYTIQGLYHPARKVREVYWKVFNTLYIYSSDALVMGYPTIEDEMQASDPELSFENKYSRTTLELFI